MPRREINIKLLSDLERHLAESIKCNSEIYYSIRISAGIVISIGHPNRVVNSRKYFPERYSLNMPEFYKDIEEFFESREIRELTWDVYLEKFLD